MLGEVRDVGRVVGVGARAAANQASRISASSAAEVVRRLSARTLASFQRRAPGGRGGVGAQRGAHAGRPCWRRSRRRSRSSSTRRPARRGPRRRRGRRPRRTTPSRRGRRRAARRAGRLVAAAAQLLHDGVGDAHPLVRRDRDPHGGHDARRGGREPGSGDAAAAQGSSLGRMPAGHDAEVTPRGVRDGDPAALQALVTRRGPAVLAFCAAVCEPPNAARAAAEAFARFRAAVAAAPDASIAGPATSCCSAPRATPPRPSRGPAGPRARGPTAAAPRRGVPRRARAARRPRRRRPRRGGRKRLSRHLSRCAACRELEAAFAPAEEAFLDPPRKPLSARGAQAHPRGDAGRSAGGPGPGASATEPAAADSDRGTAAAQGARSTPARTPAPRGPRSGRPPPRRRLRRQPRRREGPGPRRRSRSARRRRRRRPRPAAPAPGHLPARAAASEAPSPAPGCRAAPGREPDLSRGRPVLALGAPRRDRGRRHRRRDGRRRGVLAAALRLAPWCQAPTRAGHPRGRHRPRARVPVRPRAPAQGARRQGDGPRLAGRRSSRPRCSASSTSSPPAARSTTSPATSAASSTEVDEPPAAARGRDADVAPRGPAAPRSAPPPRRGVRHMAHRFIVGESPAGRARRARGPVEARRRHLGRPARRGDRHRRRGRPLRRPLRRGARRPSRAPRAPGRPGERSSATRRARCPRANLRSRSPRSRRCCAPTPRSAASATPLPRLRELLRRAKALGAHLHIDMESFDSREAITDLVLELLARGRVPRRPVDGRRPAGLPARLARAAATASWPRSARRRARTPLVVRLVKGAYWDHEVVEARQHGWEPPVFEVKADSDRNFEALTRRLLEARAPATRPPRDRQPQPALGRPRRRGQPRARRRRRRPRAPGPARARRRRCRTRWPPAACACAPTARSATSSPAWPTSSAACWRTRATSRSSPTRPRASRSTSCSPPLSHEPTAPRLRPSSPTSRCWSCAARPCAQELLDAPRRARRAAAGARAGARRRRPPRGRRLVSTDPGDPERVVAPRRARPRPTDVDAAVARRRARPARVGGEARGDARAPSAARAPRRGCASAGATLAALRRPRVRASRGPRPTPTSARRSTSSSTTRAARSRWSAAGALVPGARRAQRAALRARAASSRVIAPWNFPLAIPPGMVAAGPGDRQRRRAQARRAVARRAASMVVEALHAAGVPPGALALLPGEGDVGAALVARPARARRSPSPAPAPVGLEIMRAAAEVARGQRHLKRVGRRDGRQELRDRRRRRRPRRRRPGDRALARSATPARSARPPRALLVHEAHRRRAARAPGRRRRASAGRPGRARSASTSPPVIEQRRPGARRALRAAGRARRARRPPAPDGAPERGWFCRADGRRRPAAPLARRCSEEIFGPLLAVERVARRRRGLRPRRRAAVRADRRPVLPQPATPSSASCARSPVGNLYVNRHDHRRDGRPPAVRRQPAVRHRHQGRRPRLPAALRRAARRDREHGPPRPGRSRRRALARRRRLDARPR